MKEGYIDAHDLERIVAAIEHEMKVEPIEQPEVVVTDLESDSEISHVVNLERMDCTCDDYEYNCDEEEYCKHIFRAVFEKFRML